MKMKTDELGKKIEATLREKIHVQEYGSFSEEYKKVRLLATTRRYDRIDLLSAQRIGLN